MSTDAPTELEAFRNFLDDQIGRGHVAQSLEQALELWRQRQDLQESVAAVREALSEMDAGDTGRPLDEFVRDFRNRNNIAEDA